jgi:hypothetical protein
LPALQYLLHLDVIAFFATRATEMRAWRIDADRIGIIDTERGHDPLLLFEHEAFELYLQLADIFDPNPSAEEQARDAQESKPRRLGMAA